MIWWFLLRSPPTLPSCWCLKKLVRLVALLGRLPAISCHFAKKHVVSEWGIYSTSILMLVRPGGSFWERLDHFAELKGEKISEKGHQIQSKSYGFCFCMLWLEDLCEFLLYGSSCCLLNRHLSEFNVSWLKDQGSWLLWEMLVDIWACLKILYKTIGFLPKSTISKDFVWFCGFLILK